MVNNEIKGNRNIINQFTIIIQEAPKQLEVTPKNKFNWKKFLSIIHKPFLWIWKISVGFITLNSS